MSHGICSCNWWSTNIGICSFTHEQLPISFSSPPLVFLRHFIQMKSILLYLNKRSYSRKSLNTVCASLQHKAGIESAASIRGPHKMTIIVWFSNSDWWRPLAQSSPNAKVSSLVSQFGLFTTKGQQHWHNVAALSFCTFWARNLCMQQSPSWKYRWIALCFASIVSKLSNSSFAI